MIQPFGISVLIRTFNSARTLGSVLAGMSLVPEDEYLVVDSGSSDATLAIAQQHGAKIINAQGPFNYSKSLNLGFAAAKNPWVLVISSHAIPMTPRFLEIHREAVRQFPADVVAGYAPGDADREIQLSEKENEVVFYEKNDWAKINQICGNANTIYRRSAWEEMPFDETIRTAEDKIWFIAMAKRNHRFALIPQARAINKNQGSLGYMFRKGFSDRRALDTWVTSTGQLRGLQEGEAPATEPLKPMTPWQLGGALKRLFRLKLSGRIDFGNWFRYNAHTLGQFLGSYFSKNNTPDK